MLLKNLIKALGKEFGLSAVAKEAIGQYDVEKVRTLTKSLSPPGSQKIARIKAARILFGQGLKESKEWVEINFSDNGNGDPI